MNIWIIPSVLAIIAVILLVILIIVKSKNRIKQTKVNKEAYNEIRGKKANVETTRESLESLNKLAKKFFRAYLKKNVEMTYPEISEILKAKKEVGLADFCERMDYYLYSGKEINKQEVLAMINQFIVLTKAKKFKAMS